MEEQKKFDHKTSNSLLEQAKNDYINKKSKELTILVENEYNKVLELNDQENYFKYLNKLMQEKNYTTTQAWLEIEELLHRYKQKPMFTTIHSVFNHMSRKRKKHKGG